MPEGYRSLLVRALGESPKLRIIDYLLDYPIASFTKKEIIEGLSMSKQTFYKYFGDLEKLGLVTVSKRIGRVSLYRINLKNPMVRMISEYERRLSLQIAEQEEKRLKKPAAVRAR